MKLTKADKSAIHAIATGNNSSMLTSCDARNSFGISNSISFAKARVYKESSPLSWRLPLISSSVSRTPWAISSRVL